jgi:hypothetical protein
MGRFTTMMMQEHFAHGMYLESSGQLHRIYRYTQDKRIVRVSIQVEVDHGIMPLLLNNVDQEASLWTLLLSSGVDEVDSTRY